MHLTWAGTYILDPCVFLFPGMNFALINSDCVPVTLFKIQELWLLCVEHDAREGGYRQPPSSPIASAQKRARSVDTGQATQQQPGPPIELPKSRSVENFAASDVRLPPLTPQEILRMSFFSVQRRVASARSFNIYPSMLHMRLII